MVRNTLFLQRLFFTIIIISNLFSKYPSQLLNYLLQTLFSLAGHKVCSMYCPKKYKECYIYLIMFVLPVKRYPNHNTLKEEQAQCPLSASSVVSILAKQDS